MGNVDRALGQRAKLDLELVATGTGEIISMDDAAEKVKLPC